MATGKVQNPNSVIIRNVVCDSTTVASHGTVRFEKAATAVSGYEPLGIIGIAGISTSYLLAHFVDRGTNTCKMDLYNYSSSSITIAPTFVVLYGKA